jgi:hypothetical protein
MVGWKEGNSTNLISIVENGSKILCMEKVNIFGRMVVNMMESFS